ncbi:MAG: hypothetical protein ABFS45_14305 [Pseudomonadota bacterium]
MSLVPTRQEVLLIRLLVNLREARDRLNQTPQDNWRPPSSERLWSSSTGATEKDDGVRAREMDTDGKEQAGGVEPLN